MLGRLNLPSVSEDELQYTSCKSGRPLDSPDSGLPPSPSPSCWLQPAGPEKGGNSPGTEEERKRKPELCPRSYGEGIELDPLPPKEVRFTSSVRYDSDRHFIHDVSLQPRGLGLDSCSQTVVALSDSTWRHYRTQLFLEPRQRVQRYQSTTIVYPKYARAVYCTHLRYDCRRQAKRFLSSVELQAAQLG
ncbi:hypothetical protein JZ751_015710 [Albula glossodonta]|uniref:Refilin B n=1 Tax=Albula glossodonta TaxID=121402 RepID=A0A8T2MW41_9TELE|nr:hypothetical protein JZ751_011623 [Albula glossodonta]KAG9332174.1 hypothetical protein JZ751_015710 [Albula glossodonta]